MTTKNMTITVNDEFWKKFDEHFDARFDKKVEERFGLAPEETLDDKLKHLPTKDEFYKQMDKVMGELKTIREEQTIITHQYKRTNERIDLVDKHLGINTSDLA